MVPDRKLLLGSQRRATHPRQPAALVLRHLLARIRTLGAPPRSSCCPRAAVTFTPPRSENRALSDFRVDDSYDGKEIFGNDCHDIIHEVENPKRRFEFAVRD